MRVTLGTKYLPPGLLGGKGVYLVPVKRHVDHEKLVYCVLYSRHNMLGTWDLPDGPPKPETPVVHCGRGMWVIEDDLTDWFIDGTVQPGIVDLVCRRLSDMVNGFEVEYVKEVDSHPEYEFWQDYLLHVTEEMSSVMEANR